MAYNGVNLNFFPYSYRNKAFSQSKLTFSKCYFIIIISCLHEFLLFSQVYSQLIYLIKFIFTNRTSVDVKPGLISSKETWFDVNGLGGQKKFKQT